MFKIQTVPSKFSLLTRYYCVKTSTEKLKSFQHTILLPKTSFPNYFTPKKLVDRDEKILQEAKFLEFYKWQRENLKGEYVLHDGPPYANGKPHIGHAVNKILKDIILRSQIVQGKRVHFIPGWDCHGLPIELAALKDLKENLPVDKIRQRAREVATEMSEIQKEAFKQWGVMGDWENQCYYTYTTEYIVNQLQIFWNLFEKGFIYYGFKPIYWSPSSKTALAEAELEYKNHKSLSVVVRFEVSPSQHSEPLYLLIWTTTPWTLPLNKAVYCSPNLKYSIVRISTFSGLYIIATDLINDLKTKLKADIVEQSVISSEELKNLKYRHPWNKNQLLDIFESSNLKILGTGLLHSAPGNGHEDFILALANNLKLDCSVDEEGCYTQDAGADLNGLNVLQQGSLFVIKRLQPEILLKEEYEHSYPFDWRTKEPVIIRTSNQWFIDCDRMKDKAIEAIKNIEVPIKFFESRLRNRAYWCLSRQRKWGVPIPVFFHKTSNRPLISKSLVHHICQLFESSGPEVWWTENLEILFPKKFCDEFFVKIDDVIKGTDIMDIWFDSGVSWSYVLNHKRSEIYLEGVDQYTGWFQSSLLTSVAVRGAAPFKKIITHGFVVDANKKKMSKSLGNVIDPEDIVKGKDAFGVDTLRWWVAYNSHNDSIPVSNSILQSCSDAVKKLRVTLRFCLGALNGVVEDDIKNVNEFTYLDRYLLNYCYNLYHSIMNNYNSHNLYEVCFQTLYSVTNQISSGYIHVIKDRLYCDDINSVRRRSCQYVLNGVLDTFCHAIAPILPHLIEEVYSHHPVYRGQRKFFYNKHMWAPPEFWKNDAADKAVKLVNEIKAEISQTNDLGSLPKKCCVIQVNQNDFELLKKMQGGEEQSIDSELTEMLQVAQVQLKVGDKKFTCSPSGFSVCLRCRRCTAAENEELCKRCFDLVS